MITGRGVNAMVAAGVLSLAMTSGAVAQGTRATAMARSEAFTGCWRANAGAADSRAGSSAPLVCILPAGRDSLEFVAVADGKILSRNKLDASGGESQFSSAGCTGRQRATWSGDGRRLYTRSAATCSGGLTRGTAGMFALTPSGEWLDIQSVSAGDGGSVRVIRSRDANITGNLPAEIVSALGSRSNAVQAARLAAGAAVTTADVIEASKAASPLVTEAWLLERRQSFNLDADRIQRLADAGLPDRVLDAMVAVSYPRTFTVAHVEGAEGQADSIAVIPDSVGNRSRYAYMSPWALYPNSYGYYGAGDGYDGDYSPYYGIYGFNPYNYNGYSDYGSYGYYGGSPFYTNHGGYGYRPPVIILYGSVVPNAGGATGQAVKGKGYTRTDQGATNSGSTGSRSPAPSQSSGSSGGSSSAGSSSGGGSSSGASAAPTRTAKPRSP